EGSDHAARVADESPRDPARPDLTRPEAGAVRDRAPARRDRRHRGARSEDATPGNGPRPTGFRRRARRAAGLGVAPRLVGRVSSSDESSARGHRGGQWADRARGLIRREELRAFARRSREVIVLAAITGAFTGAGVALFDRAVVDWVYGHLVDQSRWILAFLPLAGLALAAAVLRWVALGADPDSADAYLHAFHDADHPLRLREAPGKMLAALATLGFGGAMGLEGPSLYLGASIGTFLQQKLRRLAGNVDRRLLLVAGAAAGVEI